MSVIIFLFTLILNSREKLKFSQIYGRSHLKCGLQLTEFMTVKHQTSICMQRLHFKIGHETP
jgi:hypothetical protein